MKKPVSTPLNLTILSLSFWVLIISLFSCAQEEKKTGNNPVDDRADRIEKTDTIKIPEGPLNINPDKTEYATFSNVRINDSVNTIHSVGVQLALQAFYKWLKESGAEVDQLETLNYMLMADKNNPDYLLDYASYVAHAGEQPETGIKVSKELAAKFGIDYARPDSTFLIYSYLQKNIKFRENLDVTDNKFKGEKVYFIESNENARDQVNVYYYAWNDENGFSAGDFIVELFTNDTSERVIVAQVKPEKTLDATWKKIESKINDKLVDVKVQTEAGTGTFTFPHRMNENDYFAMPAVDLKMEREIPELQGKTFVVNGRNKSVDASNHSIYFRFDNYGIILIEEVYATDSAAPDEEIIIELPPLVVKHPFMIAMKRSTLNTEGKSGAKKTVQHLPYFLSWINNTSVMIPYPKNEN